MDIFAIELLQEDLDEAIGEYEILSERRQERIAIVDTFNKALNSLEIARIYAENIKKLLDGDISEDDFRCKIIREVEKIKGKVFFN